MQFFSNTNKHLRDRTFDFQTKLIRICSFFQMDLFKAATLRIKSCDAHHTLEQNLSRFCCSYILHIDKFIYGRCQSSCRCCWHSWFVKSNNECVRFYILHSLEIWVGMSKRAFVNAYSQSWSGSEEKETNNMNIIYICISDTVKPAMTDGEIDVCTKYYWLNVILEPTADSGSDGSNTNITARKANEDSTVQKENELIQLRCAKPLAAVVAAAPTAAAEEKISYDDWRVRSKKINWIGFGEIFTKNEAAVVEDNNSNNNNSRKKW